MQEEVTHKEIYERLIAVETKVDRIDSNTVDVVAAFKAAQGAFTVLEWLAKAAKPLLWIGATIVSIGVMWEHIKFK
jgi:predicted CoA-binding protein